MTPLLARLLLPLCLLCCAAIGVTLLSGRLMPMPQHASLLTSNPCALPCVFGVVPRVTTRNEALQAFEHAALPSSVLDPALPSYAVRGSSGTRSLLALLDLSDPDGSIVRSVLLYQMESGHDLGVLSDFLLAGYQPTRVFSACGNTQRLIIVLDESGLFVQVTLGARIDPGAAVQMFGTTDGSDGMIRALDTFRCAAETDWSGFAPLWKYGAAA